MPERKTLYQQGFCEDEKGKLSRYHFPGVWLQAGDLLTVSSGLQPGRSLIVAYVKNPDWSSAKAEIFPEMYLLKSPCWDLQI
jgi:hypothetical protein